MHDHSPPPRSRPGRIGSATYHVDADDLTSGLLDLLQTPHEVPVTGLGDNLVGREDAHAVQSRGGVGLCGQMPANDLVLLKTTCIATVSKPCSIPDMFSAQNPRSDRRIVNFRDRYVSFAAIRLVRRRLRCVVVVQHSPPRQAWAFGKAHFRFYTGDCFSTASTPS